MYPILFLFSCEEPVELRTLSYSFLDADTVVEVQSIPVGYSDQYKATFRAVNEYGSSVASEESVLYYVGNASEPLEMSTDAFGYARPVVEPGFPVSLADSEQDFYPYLQPKNQTQ